MAADYPAENDLILRPVELNTGIAYYLILEAITLEYVAGPFFALGDAVIAARTLALERRATVWQDRICETGRAPGSLIRLFSIRPDQPQ